MRKYFFYVVVGTHFFYPYAKSDALAFNPTVVSSASVEEPVLSYVERDSLDVERFMPMVTVGDPCNAPDEQGRGAVEAVYEMGSYEVTACQYASFLNAVAWKEDLHGLYHSEMGSDAKVACIQKMISDDGTYHYEVIDQQRGTLPITYVSLYDAMRFCNWLENGMPGKEEEYAVLQQSTEHGAYAFFQNGNEERVELNEQAHYHLPSEDEWIKAAYYKGHGIHAGYWMYPTQHDTPPVSGMGDVANRANYQTYLTNLRNDFLDEALMITTVGAFSKTTTFYHLHDMGGNVAEWVIEPSGLSSVRGGSWRSSYSWSGKNDLMRSSSSKQYDGLSATNFIGFRVAKRPDAAVFSIENQEGLWKRATSNSSSSNDISDLKSLLKRPVPLPSMDPVFLEGMLFTAVVLASSSLAFIAAELALDYFLYGMTVAEIGATFPPGRLLIIAAHLATNAYCVTAAQQFKKK